MEKLYEVTFDIKTNNTEYGYLIYVMAKNGKEAIKKAKELWVWRNHMFHLHADRVYDDNFDIALNKFIERN